MIKLVIFDLDGVLVDLKEGHFVSLNTALSSVDPKYVISLSDHYKFYDGLPTMAKLKLLTQYKGLPETLYGHISKLKQQETLRYVYANTKPILPIKELFSELKHKGFSVAVASNSVTNTVYSVLVKQELLEYVDCVLSNQDVQHAKPNPEIYFRAISRFGLTPKECLIVEDSPFGLDAAYESGAHVMRVTDTTEVNVDNVFSAIARHNSANKPKSKKWDGFDFNVLVPMAGAGSRFRAAGYSLPKPMIDVGGKPMIQRVVDNLGINANFIFLVRDTDEYEYDISAFLQDIQPGCRVVLVEGLTEGAACTTLLAEQEINDDRHLVIANCDQLMEWDSARFYYQTISQKMDGCIPVFRSTHPKWSYAKSGLNGLVTEVAEKNPISEHATTGIYYWNRGSDYVKFAKQMIARNIRTNNEFYTCPVYNEAIQAGKKISTYNVDKMWGTGTPEDLKTFLSLADLTQF